MATNQSVVRFRRLTDELKLQVHEEAVAELNIQAKNLAESIRAVAPVYEGVATATPGALRQSVRVVPGNKDTIVRVVAGGQLTTRSEVRGTSYDYARAVEFGTQGMRPHPFFFPTYRLSKKKMISGMKRRITRVIKQYSAA